MRTRPSVLTCRLEYYSLTPLVVVARRGTLSAHRPALMSRFVPRLFADLILRSDHLTEAVMVVRLRTFFAASHSFVARCQQLARVLLPRVKRFLFFVRERFAS